MGTRWCPSSLAKLVPITPMSLWFMVDITIVFMGFINQLITGGPHIVHFGMIPLVNHDSSEVAVRSL